ncbi:hypothetical protein FRB96_000264 [Tulasnella sp. 330]|nr:hypothetical protein FRB96_000264 [Tulasnella sp. 330]KAG8886537.1 hypothetical protein FRB97_003048 [Tulasnella sp. 331]
MATTVLPDPPNVSNPANETRDDISAQDATTTRKRKVPDAGSSQEIEDYFQHNQRIKTSHMSDTPSSSEGSDQQTPSPIRDTSSSDDTASLGEPEATSTIDDYTTASTPTPRAKRQAFEDLDGLRSVLPSANPWALLGGDGDENSVLVEYTSSAGDSERGNMVAGEGERTKAQAVTIAYMETDRLREIYPSADPWPLFERTPVEGLGAGEREDLSGRLHINQRSESCAYGERQGSEATADGSVIGPDEPSEDYYCDEPEITITSALARNPQARIGMTEIVRLGVLSYGNDFISNGNRPQTAEPAPPIRLSPSGFASPLQGQSPAIMTPRPETYNLGQRIGTAELKRLLRSVPGPHAAKTGQSVKTAPSLSLEPELREPLAGRLCRVELSDVSMPGSGIEISASERHDEDPVQLESEFSECIQRGGAGSITREPTHELHEAPAAVSAVRHAPRPSIHCDLGTKQDQVPRPAVANIEHDVSLNPVVSAAGGHESDQTPHELPHAELHQPLELVTPPGNEHPQTLNDNHSLAKDVDTPLETQAHIPGTDDDGMALSILLQETERRSTRLVCRSDAPADAASASASKSSKPKRKRTTTKTTPSDDLRMPVGADGVDVTHAASDSAVASSSKTGKPRGRPKKLQSAVKLISRPVIASQSKRSNSASSLHNDRCDRSGPVETPEPLPTAALHTPRRRSSSTYLTTVEVLVSPLRMLISRPNSPNKPASRGDETPSKDLTHPSLAHDRVPDIRRLSPTPTKPKSSSKKLKPGCTDDVNDVPKSLSQRPQRNRVRPSWLAAYDDWDADADSPDPEPGLSTRKRRSVSTTDTADAPKKPKKRKTSPADGPLLSAKVDEALQASGSSEKANRSPSQMNEMEAVPDPTKPFVQQKSCIGRKFNGGSYQCHACVARRGGDGCRFAWIRRLLGGGTSKLWCGPHEFVDDDRVPEPPKYPTRWNVQPTEDQRERILSVVAKELLPVFEAELDHITQPGIITRIRELDFRTTCDYCATSVFTESWMCHDCGREFCAACHADVIEVTGDWTPQRVATYKPYRHYAYLPEGNEKTAGRLMYCNKSAGHHESLFKPVTRFQRVELEELVRDMRDVVTRHAQLDVRPVATPQIPPPNARRDVSDPIDPSGVESLPYHVFGADDLTEEIFKHLWAQGQTVLVTGLLDKFQLRWTPEALVEKYGSQECEVVECQSQGVQETTVGTFFKQFGVYEGRTQCLKLKDWPPTDEFSKAFPELFNDFAQAVPVPNCTRRDGILNIASHFPVNEKAIVPDIGPKMYNAFEASEMPGGKGSTRLHMDMADAVNIMLYASPRQDGSPGSAVWDLFQAEDAAALRNFLYRTFGSMSIDPIHSQHYYLDADLRKELFAQEGVKSWRVYQKPGEAVFIPAGCAHQVCNLADCIKVAVDFVSPENIDRCEGLTREFRKQNQSAAWKDDVLQLRQTMFHAWNSMKGFQDAIGGPPRPEGLASTYAIVPKE